MLHMLFSEINDKLILRYNTISYHMTNNRSNDVFNNVFNFVFNSFVCRSISFMQIHR